MQQSTDSKRLRQIRSIREIKKKNYEKYDNDDDDAHNIIEIVGIFGKTFTNSDTNSGCSYAHWPIHCNVVVIIVVIVQLLSLVLFTLPYTFYIYSTFSQIMADIALESALCSIVLVLRSFIVICILSNNVNFTNIEHLSL